MANSPVKGRGFSRWPKHFLSSLLLAGVLLLAACSSPPPHGSLNVTVAGLASGADIQVNGPGGFSTTVTTSTTLENLAPGDYTLVAAPAGEYFVAGDREIDVVITVGATSTATFTYERAFEFSATSDAGLISLDGSTELTATLAGLHADVTDVDVELTAPSGWDLSATGPWLDATAGTISTFAMDSSAEFGANEFVFSITGNIQGQALEHTVAVAVDLLPVVTNTSDVVATPQQGSLRYLIEHPRVEGQTITFDPAAAGGSQVVIELQDELVIDQSLNIEGLAEPAALVTLTPAAGVTARLADVLQNASGDPYEVTISRLAFVDATAPANADGGAIRSHADLTVYDSLFAENAARHGGAIFVAGGSLTATNVGFELNRAAERGGAVYANNQTRVDLLNSTFIENQATNGGAVMTGSGSPLPANRAQVLIDNSTFNSNSASSGAGAFMNYGNATIVDSHFESNTATSGGGAIRNHYRMTIEGTDVIDNEANEYGGILSDGIMSVSDSLVGNNRALSGDGGGIYSGWADGNYKIDADLKTLTIVNSQITSNTATGNGAGIYSVQILEITDSTIADNIAQGAKGGGGIFAVAVKPDAAPRDDDTLRGSITATRSTFSGNRAVNGDGGAIAVEVESGAFSPTFNMLNSTVADNSAHGNGGGIWVSNPYDGGIGTVGVTGYIAFSTIASNESITGYGGGIGTRYGDMTLRGNIVANNVMRNEAAPESQFDLYSYSGWADSAGYNWFTVAPMGDLVETISDTLGQPISLGALQDNGGPTETMRPAFESLGSVLDDVPLAQCLDLDAGQLTIDQRGVPRPGPNATCTRGAVEQQ